MDASEYSTTLRKISSRFVGITDKSSICILLLFRICKICKSTVSDLSEWIVMLVLELKSILQSSILFNKSEIDLSIPERWILIVFSLPNLFFKSSGESTAIIFPLFMIAISSQMYSASLRICSIENSETRFGLIF